MNFFKIKSYAKINLSLNVLGKLKSKLHKIESFISFIDLHDIIYIKKINKKLHSIKFYGKFSKNISKKNTVTKLLKFLDDKNLLKGEKYFFKIKKNIPQKSGMGGGSMNAAFILRYFLKKKFFKLNYKQIINISNYIGSDVITGFGNKNKILKSNGRLENVNVNLRLHLLIAKPLFGCSTKLIYSYVDKYSKPSLSIKRTNFELNNLINFKNDLEKIAIKKYPILYKLKKSLENLPKVQFVRMTGSGSVFVAYFVSKNDVLEASKIFRKKYKNYWSIISKTI